MAYIRGVAYGIDNSGSATTITPDTMPTHETDDLLLMVCGKRSTGADWTITTPASGWTTINTSQGGDVTSGTFYKVATSASETTPIATNTATNEMFCCIMVIANIDTSTPIDTSASQVESFFSKSTHVLTTAGTTSSDNTLSVYFNLMAGAAQKFPDQQSGLMMLDHIRTPYTEQSICWTYQGSSGSMFNPSYKTVSNVNGQIQAIAINSHATEIDAPHADTGNPPTEVIHPLRGVGTSGPYGGGSVDPSTDLSGGVGPTSETFNYRALQAEGGEGVDAVTWAQGMLSTGSGSGYDGLWGAIWNLSAGDYDATGQNITVNIGVLSGNRLSAVDTVANGGYIVGIRTDNGAAGNIYRFWNVGAVDSAPNPFDRYAVVFDPSDTTYQWGADIGSGTIDLTKITGIFLGGKKTAQVQLRIMYAECHALNAVTIIGGGSGAPCDLSTFVDSMKAPRIKTIINQGGASDTQILSLQTLQVGNGTDPVYFDQNLASLEFATTTTGTNLQYNVGDNGGGITFYAVTGDTINFTNSTISGGTVWDFAIHASSTLVSGTEATWDFSGLNIINADVVLRDVFVAASGISFIDCASFTANSADLSGGCTFDNTPVTITGSTQTALQTLLDNYANADTKNNATALRVEYTGTGDITLSADAITWTGNTVDIHYNSTASSTLTVTMQNGSNATTYAISGSAVAVVIASPITIYTAETTDIVAGSRLWVKNITTDIVVVDEIRATDWSLNYTEGTDFTIGDEVQIRVSHSSGAVYKEPFNVSLIAGAGFNALIEQEAWTAVNNWAIDGSAETDWTADGTNIDIDITGSGSSTKKAMVAWWAYYITTSDGINNFWGAYVVESTNSIRQEVSVVDVVIEKTSAGNFQFTDNDVRYYRSDFSTPYDTTGNSIFMDYSGVPLIVETGVSGLTAPESTQLFTTSTFDPAVDTVEGSETYQEALRLIRAEAAGKLAVSGTTVTIRDAADSKDRITATVDSNGQRTSVTTDAS